MQLTQMAYPKDRQSSFHPADRSLYHVYCSFLYILNMNESSRAMNTQNEMNWITIPALSSCEFISGVSYV